MYTSAITKYVNMKASCCNKVSREKLFLFFFGAITLVGLLLIMFMPNSIRVHTAIMIVLAVVAVLYSGLKLDNPFCWFPLFFCLYNCSYWLLVQISPIDELVVGYSGMNAILVITAFAVTLVFAMPRRQKACLLVQDTFSQLDKKIWDWLFYCFLIALFVCVLVLLAHGVTSKQEQWESRNMSWILATYFTRFLVFLDSCFVINLGSRKKGLWKIALSGVAIAWFSLCTGERDALLRFLICLVMSFSMVGKIKPRLLFLLAPVGFAIMIASAYLKYFFSTGEVNSSLFSSGSLLYAFLYSDFAPCGSNLQVVLNHPDVKGVLGWGQIVRDLCSSFMPNSLLIKLFGADWNASEWYNVYFFPGASWNRAFSLVAEGYVIGGVLGVAVIFAFIGVVVRKMHEMSRKGPWQAGIYVYGIASIASSFRGDLASFFQAFFRGPIFIFVVVWISKLLLSFWRKGKSNLCGTDL